MINRKAFLFIQLLVIGLFLTTVNSCQKEEDPIVKKDPVITWANPAEITSGTLLSETQLNATADVAGTFAYSPASGTILSVGAAQILKADFTPTDAVNYNTATKTVTINVIGKIDPIITWANPADITSGTLLSETQLNATADVPGTFIYTPGIGTMLSEGANQDLKVDFTPTDETVYNSANKTVKINVIALSETVTDIDGNVYNTVTIGTQTWMLENLKTTKYNDGTDIPNITDVGTWEGLLTPGYCWYENDIDNKATYGALYNFYTVNTAKLAPTGWHVPTDEEFTTLTDYLGGAYIAGGKLKEAGTEHWYSPNAGATNETGFTALPGGFRSQYGLFDFIKGGGFWWSATEGSATEAHGRNMYYDGRDVWIDYGSKKFGASVRCIKD